MSFSFDEVDGVTVVKVQGELIVGNRAELKQGVLERLDGDARKFVVDFSDSTYIDSSGLGMLVTLSRKIREVDGALRLAGLNEDLLTLFALTKLDTLFTIVDDRAIALADF
jgi:anti-sigma B factor antagonist